MPVAHSNFQMPNSDPFIDVSCPIQEGDRFAAVVVPSCPKKTHYLLLIPVVRNQEGGRFAAVLVPSCPMVTFLWMPPVVRIQEGGAVVVPSCPTKTQYLLMPVARRNQEGDRFAAVVVLSCSKKTNYLLMPVAHSNFQMPNSDPLSRDSIHTYFKRKYSQCP